MVDDSAQARARGWRTLAALYALIEAALEPALQEAHGLSVVEYAVLDALSRQERWHMRMQPLVQAIGLSPSATTRLVNRLESRGLLSRCLCPQDRRGIYTEATEAGRELLGRARPTHDAVLEATLARARERPELASLVSAISDAGRAGEAA